MPISVEDRTLLEGLCRDPDARPSFDFVKACLIWPDERPTGLSIAGRQFLSRLWIVRGFMHRDMPSERWGIDPAPNLAAWNYAQETGLRWPGFGRLVLSEQDRNFLMQSLADQSAV